MQYAELALAYSCFDTFFFELFPLVGNGGYCLSALSQIEEAEEGLKNIKTAWSTSLVLRIESLRNF